MTSNSAAAVGTLSRGARIRIRLAEAHLYLCIDARRQFDNSARSDGFTSPFPALWRDTEAALQGGTDIVQLRDKNSPGAKRSGALEASEEIAALETMRQLCDEHGALLAANDRADIAAVAGVDVLHLGQKDLPVERAREIVGPDMIIGRSCHSPADVEQALADPEVDYFCTGPVWTTPTKPGRRAVGLDLVTFASELAHPGDPDAKPWFAIGGIDLGNVCEVTEAGASRLAVVRAVSGAADPTLAASTLRSNAVGRR